MEIVFFVIASSISVLAILLFLLRMMSGRNLKTARAFRQNGLRLCIVAVVSVVVIFVLVGYASNAGMLYSEEKELQKMVTDSLGTRSTSSGRQFEYGIIFDAGSTGSRIHVFKLKCIKGSGIYELEDELFDAVKPGLSSYAEHPKEGAKSLIPMLSKACNYIPKDQWQETPIALKATAGLRMLSNEAAQHILDEVSVLFKSYSFKMDKNSVSILEGTDEGLFCWFTVNFLHGYLTSPAKTLGVLDLGGGSTQITFLSSTASTKSMQRIVEVDVFGAQRTLYSHSYLGLGLNSGRFQTLGGKETADGVEAGQFDSACLPDNYKDTWTHAGKQHTLRSVPNVTSRFNNCYAAVQKVIKSYDMDHPTELSSTTFYALSYYVDKATAVNLIDAKVGGNLTVDHFYDAAQQECRQVPKNDPFRCLDLCYISALLHDGLGLQKATTLHLRKQIRNIEIAWPLGAMFDVYGLFKRVSK